MYEYDHLSLSISLFLFQISDLGCRFFFLLLLSASYKEEYGGNWRVLYIPLEKNKEI